MGMGIGLLLYGIFIISMSDNLLRIKLVGGKGDVHPLTVLIGLIGGINLFGLIGIFIGPIALSLLITFLKDFSGSYK
jgi:predicted PurR-regulated permease PerM